MPIAFAPSNTEMTVRKISAEDKVRRHLQEGRLCLDKTLAGRILVS